MTARVVVREDWHVDGISIAFAVDGGQGRARVLSFPAIAYVDVDTTANPPEDTWLRLPEDVGRALYEALSRHYGGHVVDATALRRDYDHERVRVDRLIGALIEVPS